MGEEGPPGINGPPGFGGGQGGLGRQGNGGGMGADGAGGGTVQFFGYQDATRCDEAVGKQMEYLDR